MNKICNNVRHYITTAIQWSFNVKILYWWRLIIKKLKRFVCKDCLYSTLLINHCVRGSAMVWYECIVISWQNLRAKLILWVILDNVNIYFLFFIFCVIKWVIQHTVMQKSSHKINRLLSYWFLKNFVHSKLKNKTDTLNLI